MPQRSQTGPRIRAMRMSKGLSQQKLAQLAGISPSYLNLIEHDRRRIGGSVLGAIAEALGVSTAQAGGILQRLGARGLIARVGLSKRLNMCVPYGVGW